MTKPTIYEVLKSKLNREPSHQELCEEVRRIKTEVLVDMATSGKLKFQRRNK